MNPFQHLFGGLALFSYLLAGGWGPGSYWMRCEDSDGTIEFQTLFTLCCADQQEDPDEAVEMDGGAGAELRGPDRCRVCVDTPLFNDVSQAKQERSATTFTSDAFAAAALCVSPPSTSPHLLLPLYSLPSHLGGAAHMSVATVVLRC